MGYFRPIALCNTIYRIITKIIARRLRKFIDKVISKDQSGFSPGRSIVEGIIVSHEAIHMVKKLRIPSMTVKLDILKAYDLVERDFLLKVLKRFGFDNNLVDWINGCIGGPKFSILVNGVVQGIFGTTKRVRQGDPLSPFLFIIMTEDLGRSIF